MAEEMIGKYRVTSLLAEGGMGEILLAKQSGPAGFEKEVAVKRMHRRWANDPRLVAMFLDEARIAARLNHPNIVQVTDFGKLDNTYFLCMERLTGADLKKILNIQAKRQQFIPLQIVAMIASAVCDGLQY